MSSPYPASACPIRSPGPPCDTSWKWFWKLARRPSPPRLLPLIDKKFRSGTELELRKEKISEGQNAAEALDALERIGPAELERNSAETSRGPYHYSGTPQ